MITDRDKTAISLLSQGFACKEIASQMGVHTKTINNRFTRLRRVFKARTAAHLVRLAMEQKEIA